MFGINYTNKCIWMARKVLFAGDKHKFTVHKHKMLRRYYIMLITSNFWNILHGNVMNVTLISYFCTPYETGA